MLLDWDATIEATTKDHSTVLHIACAGSNLVEGTERHAEVVKVLLDRGVNMDARNDHGGTALHEAESRISDSV